MSKNYVVKNIFTGKLAQGEWTCDKCGQPIWGEGGNPITGERYWSHISADSSHKAENRASWKAPYKLPLPPPAQGDALPQDIQRLVDLVRYMRHELFDAKLISDDEFAALVADSEKGQRVARLESYDALRTDLHERIRALEEDREMWAVIAGARAGDVELAQQRAEAAEERIRALKSDLSDRNNHIKYAYAALGEVNNSIYLFDHIYKLKSGAEAAEARIIKITQALAVTKRAFELSIVDRCVGQHFDNELEEYDFWMDKATKRKGA